MLSQNTLKFLENLGNNNNREWFQANRKDYEIAKADFEQHCQLVLEGIARFQPQFMHTKVKDCIFRINRDIRFSNDKTPYKKYFSAAFGVGGRHSGKIDYYLHCQPNGESILGGGMWQPTAANLAKFRQEIDYNVTELKNIIEENKFREYFKEIHGKKLKSTPKGYPADHSEIELLRYQELFFMHRFSDAELISPSFPDDIVYGCQLLKPYLDWLNYLFYEEKEE